MTASTSKALWRMPPVFAGACELPPWADERCRGREVVDHDAHELHALDRHALVWRRAGRRPA
jgi:hypothetical protein